MKDIIFCCLAAGPASQGAVLLAAGPRKLGTKRMEAIGTNRLLFPLTGCLYRSLQMNPDTICGMGRETWPDIVNGTTARFHKDSLGPSKCSGPACQPTDGEIVEFLEAHKDIGVHYQPMFQEWQITMRYGATDSWGFTGKTIRLAVTAAIKAERRRRG